MRLSENVQQILESIREQNGDDEVDAQTALATWGEEKSSTFNQLTPTQQLQYALIITHVNRDQLVEMYNKLAEERNQLARVVRNYGNRAARRAQ